MQTDCYKENWTNFPHMNSKCKLFSVHPKTNEEVISGLYFIIFFSVFVQLGQTAKKQEKPRKNTSWKMYPVGVGGVLFPVEVVLSQRGVFCRCKWWVGMTFTCSKNGIPWRMAKKIAVVLWLDKTDGRKKK